MNTLVFHLPAMYGDHHVLRVREILTNVEGVGDVMASAARRMIAVSLDETLTSSDAIQAALDQAGYPPDSASPAIALPRRHEDGSAWFTVLGRSTTTERKDREMAGDFRRY